MNQSMRLGVAVVTAQAILVGVYWWVEHYRAQQNVFVPELSTAAPERLHGPMPPLSLRSRDGGQVALQGFARPTLVHFWATWCSPCRAELPGLLALPDEYGIELVAIALDEQWSDVDRFFAGRSPSNARIGKAVEIESALGVRSLPVTYLVDPGGQLRFRFDGARDWTDARFLSTWIDEDGRE